MSKKYGIVFDTGIARSGGEKIKLNQLFSGAFEEVADFLTKNKVKNVSLCLPDIVLREVINQRVLQIKKIIGTIENGFNSLSVFTVIAPDNEYKNKNYEELLKESSIKELKDKNINLLSFPNELFEETIERSLKHKQPFREEGDKGFKDTLLWLSVIEYFRDKDENVCVFISTNKKDFNNSLHEEFRERTGKQIMFIDSIQELKEYLDKEIPLNLHLQKLHEEIANEIKDKTGDIIMYLNKNEIPNNNPPLWSDGIWQDTVSLRYYSAYETEDPKDSEIIGYTFNSMTINDIKNLKNDLYEIEVVVIVNEKYSKYKNRGQGVYDFGYSPVFASSSISPERTRLFKMVINYKKESGLISVKSCVLGFS